ncbi:MAG: hypothetical protein J6J00_10015 [Treponema sp.]|nr:hypothetical protein [Treponema sp.]
MKKIIGMLAALAVAVVLMGCKTSDFYTAEVGWANYAQITVKDFNPVGIVSVEAVEENIIGPFHFSVEHKGKRVTYGDLMEKAKAIGADDIINVRIDKRAESKSTLLDFFTGSSSKVTYTGTALAIKYKSVEKEKVQKSGGAVELQDVGKAPSIIDTVTGIFK